MKASASVIVEINSIQASNITIIKWKMRAYMMAMAISALANCTRSIESVK